MRGWFGTNLLLDQLQNAFVQLFLDGERIFWHLLSNVSADGVIIKIMEKGVCCQIFDFLNKND